MDADIADILASVSAPRVPERTLDLQGLTRAWINERTAPDLLPYPAELVDRIIDRIRQQVRCKEFSNGKDAVGGSRVISGGALTDASRSDRSH